MEVVDCQLHGKNLLRLSRKSHRPLTPWIGRLRLLLESTSLAKTFENFLQELPGLSSARRDGVRRRGHILLPLPCDVEARVSRRTDLGLKNRCPSFGVGCSGSKPGRRTEPVELVSANRAGFGQALNGLLVPYDR